MAGRAGRRSLSALRRPGRALIAIAVLLFAVLVFGRGVAVFYTDALWFNALGHGDVFWNRLFAVAGVRFIMGGIGAALILANLWYVLRQLGPVHLRRRYGNLEIAEQVPRSYLVGGALLISVLAGWWLSALQFTSNGAMSMLAWLRAEPWGMTDPLFGHDLSFYVFTLPAWTRILEFLLIILVWSVLLVAIGYVLVGAVRIRGARWEIDDRPRLHFAILIAALLAGFGVHLLLERYYLLYQGGGFSGAIGYTDVHARLPARVVLGILAFLSAASLLWAVVRRAWLAPVVALGLFLLAAIGMGTAWPALVQKVQVEPNELAREVGYIRWNLDFTRRAYGLDAIERMPFEYERATAQTWNTMAPALAQLPLWDLAPLQTLYNELEAERSYYYFPDVDFDRYPHQGGVTHVAVGVREFAAERLSEQNQTWQMLHLNPMYTRGMGVVATPTAQKQGGDPIYWLRDVMPVHRSPAAPASLELAEPSIYFGETMRNYAIVGHVGQFAGEGVETIMESPGVATGVPLSSFTRILAFAWRFRDQNLLFARELGDTSRILFRRSVRERVAALAPFLHWDGDPQPVVLDGRVVWIVDGYTYTTSFPLSRPHAVEDLGSVRYLRSGVKAVVDGVSGATTLYMLENPDPILRTYAAIFPELFRTLDELPAQLVPHLRYPTQLFRAQASLLREFHVDRAEQFYAGQDVWELPGEIATEQRAAFRSDFTSAVVPGGSAPEFVLMHPFIARERQNMRGLLLARSDPGHYGELILLEMPRDDQIRGPAQVQSIIEQDPVIAEQLTLWRARGSTVQLGRLRILPTENSILYVEPLFLSASEHGIPQLQRVIVTDGTAVAMADDIQSAIAQLVGGARPVMDAAPDPGAEPTAAPTPSDDWHRRAMDLMQEADRRLRAGDFAGFGEAWSRLRAHLQERAAGPPSP